MHAFSSAPQYLFKALVGSQAYGTATPTSDRDYKGVYVQHPREILAFSYREQLEVSKDEVYFEVRRFLELIRTANPTLLELLYMPGDCVLDQHPAFELILRHRDRFLTTRCLHSFGGYAVAQIKKARGLDKKMNWEHQRVERKTPLDFCYAYERGRTLPLSDYLIRHGLGADWCGLVSLQHFRDGYALYYDEAGAAGQTPLGYRGIVAEDSTQLRLSSVPKDAEPRTIVYYNQDGYSMHCRDFREYTQWLENRNIQRFVDVKGHGQPIDGKNLLHCRRLLDMAAEIARDHTIRVRRPNADYLLQIRRGEIDLATLIDQAEADLAELEGLYARSGLPADVDADWVEWLLLEVRDAVAFP